MEINITTISANGQIVIPKDIRENQKLEQGAKFLVIAKDGNIILKHLTPKTMSEDLKLMSKMTKKEPAKDHSKASEEIQEEST